MTDAERWYRERFARTPERDALFTTLSGEQVAPLYTPDDVGDVERIGFPGEYPFTRGVYPSMYRGRLWTMRQFAGFGTAEETNERFRYLLDHGQTGLSTAFDMPTLMGHDSDHRALRGRGRARGRGDRHARRHGDAVRRDPHGRRVDLDDDQRAGRGDARVLRRRRRAPGRAAGAARAARSRTTSSRSTSRRRSGASRSTRRMRLVTDMIEFCARRMPRWHPVSISGYHIREAGSTAQQELAFTLTDGFAYVEQALERGLDVDEFAPRLSFFFNAHIDFFEEIAKYRAARRIWARELTRDLRRARRALAPDALPHPDRGRLAHGAAAAQQHRAHRHRGARGRARRHPVAAHELLRRDARAADRGGRPGRAAHAADHRRTRPASTNTIDPLGGSYFVEALTDRMEEAAYAEFRKIDELGGMVEAIKQNYPQREIAEASFRLQEEFERGERVIVGVNRYEQDDDAGHGHPADPGGARAQADRPRPGGARGGAMPTRWRPPWPSSARRRPPTAT